MKKTHEWVHNEAIVRNY